MKHGGEPEDGLRDLLASAAQSRSGAHASLDLLTSYHAGELEGAAEDGVRDHLVACRRCAERLLDLRLLMQPEPAAVDGVANLAVESAWRRFRALSGAAGSAAPVARRSRWPVALAATLATVALLLGLWAARLERANAALRLRLAGASAPIVNLPVVYFDGATRAAAERRVTVDLPGPASHYALIFALADLLPADEYEVRFLDERGRVLLVLGGLKMSAAGGLRLGIPRDALPAGDYRIRLRARQGSAWRLVEEYQSRIRYLPSSAAASIQAESQTP